MTTPHITRGDTLQAWPGTRPGRSAITTARTGVVSVGAQLGVYVERSTDGDGKPTPGGFYALTHVQPIHTQTRGDDETMHYRSEG